MKSVYVLMQKRSTKGFSAVYVPFGVVGTEAQAVALTSRPDRYFSEFNGQDGRWMEHVRTKPDDLEG